MSDAQKLKDAIEEYRKANKHLDERLNKIEAETQSARQAAMEQSRRQT